MMPLSTGGIDAGAGSALELGERSVARRSAVTSKIDEAYVLATFDLGEADLIVTLLAEHAGRVRGVAPSARKSRRRFGGALEPLTRVRASWNQREGRDLHRIESLEPLRSFATMQSDPARLAACAVLAEVTAATSREGQDDSTTFRLLGVMLEALESGLDPWVAIRYFEYWTLRLHGVLTDLEACVSCGGGISEPSGRWVAAGGRLLCDTCVRRGEAAGRLSRRDLAMLAAAASRPPSGLAEFRDVARPGGSVERLLLGALEAFAERSFRTYHHLRALAS